MEPQSWWLLLCPFVLLLGPVGYFLGPVVCFLGPVGYFLGLLVHFLGPFVHFLGPLVHFLGLLLHFLGPVVHFLGPLVQFLGLLGYFPLGRMMNPLFVPLVDFFPLLKGGSRAHFCHFLAQGGAELGFLKSQSPPHAHFLDPNAFYGFAVPQKKLKKHFFAQKCFPGWGKKLDLTCQK